MHSNKYLDIKGYRDEPVPHTFFQQDTDTHHMAVLLPGMGYTALMPLMYYPANIMLELGADVLRLEYEYNRREDFMALKGNERKQWLITDVTNACQTVLRERSYREITLIGKSIGTRAMGHLITTNDQFRSARVIWLTPLLGNERLRSQICKGGRHSLIVIGTNDHQYDQNHLEEVKKATGGESLIIDGADHSLEIKGSVMQSLKALERVISTIQAFLNLEVTGHG